MQRENELVKAKVNIKERGQTGFMRLAAEVDNYRKRRGQDKMKLEKDAMATVIKSFTPMLEAFENSESVLNLETDKEKQLHSNYQALYRQVCSECADNVLSGASDLAFIFRSLLCPDDGYFHKNGHDGIFRCPGRNLQF